MTFNMCDWGKHEDPESVVRYRSAVEIVAERRPHVLFGQELYMREGMSPQDAAARFAEAAGMDDAVAVRSRRGPLALFIAWRNPAAAKPGSVRRLAPEVLWHSLLGVTLFLDGVEIDCWNFHGRPRVGRSGQETLVEAERVAEARFVAGEVTGPDTSPLAVVCADWNWLPGDKLGDGSYWHPDPVFPPGLTPAMQRLALSRAPGKVLVAAGLASVGASLRRPLTHTSTGHGPPALKGTDYGARLIDEALVTPPLVDALVDHGVVDTPKARATSDHLPVMFTFDTNLIR